MCGVVSRKVRIVVLGGFDALFQKLQQIEELSQADIGESNDDGFVEL